MRCRLGGQLAVVTANVHAARHRWSRWSPWPGEPPPGDYVQLDIIDNGTGMTAEVQRHLFRGFFSTKARRSAAPVSGLWTCHEIVKQHGGYISCRECRSGAAPVCGSFCPPVASGVRPTWLRRCRGSAARQRRAPRPCSWSKMSRAWCGSWRRGCCASTATRYTRPRAASRPWRILDQDDPVRRPGGDRSGDAERWMAASLAALRCGAQRPAGAGPFYLGLCRTTRWIPPTWGRRRRFCRSRLPPADPGAAGTRACSTASLRRGGLQYRLGGGAERGP